MATNVTTIPGRVDIASTGQFSVNVPTVEMTAVTDYTGLVSGAGVDKSGLFEVFHGHLDAALLIRQCPLCMVPAPCRPVRPFGRGRRSAQDQGLSITM
ncbi:hypothetical protein [Nitratidesulfovibrio sp. 1201_IL3209]|uniref:hypothetical protein n=1 Tax=Nitratidesulfovibrio sp. 1201_IL3209 TaxID=3084053 RepID=UPI002FDB2EE6